MIMKKIKMYCSVCVDFFSKFKVFKGTVSPKMKIQSLAPHHQANRMSGKVS